MPGAVQGNAFLGSGAGRDNTDGSENCLVGQSAGYENISDSHNTFLGNYSGYSNTAGHRNVFLGYQAGYNETGSDKPYVANSQVVPPLIYGDFSSGRIGFGTLTPQAEIYIDGGCNVSTAYSIAGSTVVEADDLSNTHIGIGAGFENTSSSCTLVGYHAGYVNGAAANTFIGSHAGAATTTGGLNTIVGALA